MADPVPLASAQVSNVQCTVFGLHLLPVRSEVPPAETMSILFFSRVTSATASDTEEVGTSRMRSTPLLIVPLPSDRGAIVRLVLVVGRDNLGLDALVGRLEVLDRHFGGDDRAWAGDVGEG